MASKPKGPPSPKGDNKKNRSLVPARTYSCEMSELMCNPCGVHNTPKPGKYKGHRGPNSGRAGGNPPSPVHAHKDAIRARNPRRPATARRELDLTWFQEGNPERCISRSTKDRLEDDLRRWRYADAAGRKAILGEVGVHEQVALAGDCDVVALLRARALDAIESIPVVREKKEVRVKPVQQPQKQAPPRLATAPHFVPRKNRGAVAKALEDALRNAGLTPAARERARKLLRDEYGILVTL